MNDELLELEKRAIENASESLERIKKNVEEEMKQEKKDERYKLFNTDGKTFFDFRSDPQSRCEGFTLSYLDDGTVVMSGDYGTLCWKRNYHHAEDKEFDRDYGFPNKETNIGYFAEKVCQFGIRQEIKDWDEERAKKEAEEQLFSDFSITKEEADNWSNALFHKEEILTGDKEKKNKVLDFLDGVSFNSEEDMNSKLRDLDNDLGWGYDLWEYNFGEDYTYHFKFIFEVLQSISEQVWKAVKEKKDV